MNLKRLKWITVALPIAFLAFIQIAAMVFVGPKLGDATGQWAAAGVLAIGVVIFSSMVFRILGGMQQRILRQNEELSALNAVARAVSGSADIQETATRALENVMEVTGASAGEIVISAQEPDEQPVRLHQGAIGALNRLDCLWESNGGQGEASRPGQETLIVDLEQTSLPAVVAAYKQGFRSIAWVPLRAQNRLLGVMTLLAGQSSHLASENSERLLAAMGSQIAVAIQASHLYQDVLRRSKEAQALYEIGLAQREKFGDVSTILRSIVDQAREILGGETVALCLTRGYGGGLKLASMNGPGEAFSRPAVQIPLNSLGPAPQDSPPPDLDAPCSTIVEQHRVSHLSAPLLAGTTVIGELCVSSQSPHRFSERHRKLLANLADMAAIAISNARLLESERHVAVLEERERLAREMHDSLAQVLGYLRLRALAASNALARPDMAKVGKELKEIASVAHEGYLDVREAVLGLSHAGSSAEGVIENLKDYVLKFIRQSGIEVELTIVDEDELPEFSPEVQVQLVRVVQEALTNIRKHARAATARIWIGQENGETCIRIEDDGLGFDPALVRGNAGSRFGVRIMTERIEKVGGRLEIDSTPGSGTRVRVLLPNEEARIR